MSARRAKQQARWDAGFTLLELLVTLALLGLLAVLLSGGLRFGIRAWERSSAHAAGTDQTSLAQRLLRRELSRAYPYLVTGDQMPPHIDFTGSPEAVNVLAPVPLALAAGGRARVSFRVASDGDGRKLVMTAQPELADDDQPPATDVLLANLSSLEFSYFGRLGGDSEPRWHDAWKDQIALPRLIRVRAAFPAGDPRHWPDLIVAPRITVDVGCTYDPLTKRCRGR